MAHSFVWIVVASVLSTFRIEKAVRDGRVIEPSGGAFTPGILACVRDDVSLNKQMGAPKNSSAALNRAQRTLKHWFARPQLHDWGAFAKQG